MKQFIAWARVSSKHQEREGWSLDEQDSRLAQMAKQRGGTIVKHFRVAETASKPAQREVFNQMIAYARANAKDLSGILFVKVDRATRNLGDWNTLETLEREYGVNLIFPDQPAGDTPAGRFQRRVVMNMAAFTVEQQTVDIRAGLKRRAIEQGLPNGKVTYGYRSLRVNGKSILEIDPVKGERVQTIYRLYASEPLTIDSLITRLASDGIVYTDSTRLFPRAVLYRILTNQAYLSRVMYQGDWYSGTFPPLIDASLWQSVQDRLGGRVYHAREMVYAGGFATCEHCGHVVTGEQKIKNGRAYVYYRCSRYSSGNHPKERWTQAQFDDQMLAVFDGMRRDTEIADWFRDVITARASAEQAVNASRLQALHRKHADINARLTRLLDMRLGGELTPQEYTEKREALTGDQTRVLAQLEGAGRANADNADLAIAAFELSQSLRSKWEKADYAAKKTILDIITDGARLNSEGLRISLRNPFDLLAETSLFAESGAMGI